MDDDNNNGGVCLREPSSFPAGPAAALSAGTTTFINQDSNNNLHLSKIKFENAWINSKSSSRTASGQSELAKSTSLDAFFLKHQWVIMSHNK